MKFRTELNITPLEKRIDYSSKIFAIGSCFAQHIAERLSVRKFDTVTSPLGIAFNPASIASSLCRYWNGEHIEEEQFSQQNGLWTTFEAHSQLAFPSKEEAKAAVDNAIMQGQAALHNSNFILITFGTAWVYRLKSTGKIVANCHKYHRDMFCREALSIEDIVGLYEPLFETIFCDKEVIFTVSPIRHLGDGLEENFLSKSLLRVAIAELCRRHNNAHYFAAYELLMDDLRDYRFYADDMLHPSQQAAEYIWQKFFTATISELAKSICERVERIVKAAQHRPLNTDSEEFKRFCRQQLEAIGEFPSLDFSQEVQHFRQYIDKI